MMKKYISVITIGKVHQALVTRADHCFCKLPVFLSICQLRIVRFYSIPHSKRFDDSIVLRYLRFINILVKKLMSIDVDWWWKIHDVKRSMPRANISVSSPATRSSQCCLSFSLSLSSRRPLFPTYLPVSPYLRDCRLPLVNVTRSRSPTKNLQQQRWLSPTLAASLRPATVDLVHGQCYTWCEPAIARGRLDEGEAVLDDAFALDTVLRDRTEIWTSASMCIHHTFCAKCGCLVIEIECNLFGRCVTLRSITKIAT